MEKVRYKIAFDRDPLLTTMVDKIAARELVEELVGSQVLTRVFTSGEFSKIVWSDLPREFVIKATHGSGGVVVVWDGAPAGSRLPTNPGRHPWGKFQVRPENLDLDRLIALCHSWMDLDFFWYPGKRTPEWAYAGVPPRLICEEVLRDAAGALPSDYKFHVVHGRVQFIRVLGERTGSSYTGATFDREWNLIDVGFKSHGKTVPPSHQPPAIPLCSTELIRIAESLGGLTDSVRVDLYAIEERVVFGELTIYDAAGEGAYQPRSFDVKIGNTWLQKY